jgi:flagellar motor switch protein FliM
VPTSLSLIKVEPLKGTGMIMMDPRLVFIIVDNFFGGNGSIPARMEGRDLTQTELRVIEKVVKICFVELAKAWQPILDVQFSLYSHEVNPHLANIVGPSEVVVVSSFQIDLEGGGGEIHVVLPYSMIEPIRPILDAGVQSDMSDTDDRWSILLKEELMHAKVELTGLFAEKTLKVSDLINLKSGDIVPIRMPDQVTLMADDMPILRGQYGEHGGKVSIKIENVLVLTDYNDPK